MKERPDSEVPTSGRAAELFASPPLRGWRLPSLSNGAGNSLELNPHHRLQLPPLSRFAVFPLYLTFKNGSCVMVCGEGKAAWPTTAGGRSSRGCVWMLRRSLVGMTPTIRATTTTNIIARGTTTSIVSGW